MGCGGSTAVGIDSVDSHESTWSHFGGDELEPLLEHITLVDARWLLQVARKVVHCYDENGIRLPAGVVPAWQQLPPEAKVKVNDLRQSKIFTALPVGVLSYGWASKAHPDPTGEQLQKLRPLLEAIVLTCGADNFAPTFGILWDYLSLPQRGRTTGFVPDEVDARGKVVKSFDDRNQDQIERLRKGLGSINVWYGHDRTFTLVLNTGMPAGSENMHPYGSRGWCIFERCLSSLVKDTFCYLELSKMKVQGAGRPQGQGGPFFDFVRECRAERPPPMSPEAFEAMMRQGVATEEATPGAGIKFTSGKDLTEVIIPQYEKGFLRLLGASEVLEYGHLSFGDQGVKMLLAALAYAEAHGPRLRLLKLAVHDNQISDEGARAIELWLTATTAPLQELVLSENQLSEAAKASLRRLCEARRLSLRGPALSLVL